MYHRHPLYSKYLVSKCGKVCNDTTGQVLAPIKHRAGYLYVNLGKKCRQYIHRLVAQTFIDNPYNKPCVNHINGIKSDNRAENLEWCTPYENMMHGWDTGQFNRNVGENNSISKLTWRQVVEIISKYRPYKYTQQKLAQEYGVSRTAIQQIVEGRSWIR